MKFSVFFCIGKGSIFGPKSGLGKSLTTRLHLLLEKHQNLYLVSVAEHAALSMTRWETTKTDFLSTMSIYISDTYDLIGHHKLQQLA